MKKILLFYPSFISDCDTKPLYTDIPLSVISLAQALEKDFRVAILDERVCTNYKVEETLEEVFLVGISATTSGQITNGLRFAEKVRQYNAAIPIAWGGWHPSLMPYETIRHPLVDIVMIGQGENTFRRVAERIENGQDLRAVPNILYKAQNGQIMETEKLDDKRMQIPETMQDGYRYVEMRHYIHAEWGNNRILGYESSRGCPYSCRFCSIRSVYKHKWYGLPAKNVICDLRYLKDTYQIDAVHFFDNNLFTDKKRILEFANLALKEKLQIRWDGTVALQHFSNFSPNEIEFLKKSGFYRIIVGVESGDEQVLRKLNKEHKNEQVLKLIAKCKEHNILPSLSFMVGFPWNPARDTLHTIELIEQIKDRLPETEILLFLFSPYVGTPVYRDAIRYGMRFPSSLEGWANFTYDRANTPWVSASLRHKIDRYLKFFGTKELLEENRGFYQGFELK